MTAEERTEALFHRWWDLPDKRIDACEFSGEGYDALVALVAAAIREAEVAMRERCAKVADGKAAEFNAKAAASVERDEWESMALGASLTAEAIRAGEV